MFSNQNNGENYQKLDINTRKYTVKRFCRRKKKKEFIKKKHLLKPFLLMSPFYDVIISNRKTVKMIMDDPIRIILLLLNFISQGLSDKNQK